MKPKLILALAVAAAAQAAHAANDLEPLMTATRAASDVFAREQPAHVEHLAGFKAWRTRTDIHVRIYVIHDGTNIEFTYSCKPQNDALTCEVTL